MNGEMAYKYREELVGKRFLSVKGSGKLKVSKISEWEWRSGVVRAVSSRDTMNTEFTVLVEFDDCDWQKREWIKVHEVFQIFWVEHTLVWAYRSDPHKPQSDVIWPGLSFKPLVDKASLGNSKKKPIEFFLDRYLGLVEEKDFQIYQEGDEKRQKILDVYSDLKKEVKSWVDYQDGQRIILTTPTVLVGYRVEVYRAEGTTQWYTAVIQSYNHTSKCLAVTDDTVLEEHNEDPALIQMRLIDDGIVDLILRGVEVGIAPRRRPRKDNSTPKEQPAHLARRPNQILLPQIQTIRPSNRSAKARQQNLSGNSTPEQEKTVQEKTSSRKPAQVQRERKRRSDINETKQLVSPGKKLKSETVKEQVTLIANSTNTKELKVQVEDIGLLNNNTASSVKDKIKTTRRTSNLSGAKTNVTNNVKTTRKNSPSPVLKESKSDTTVKVKVSASKSRSSENRKCKGDKGKSAQISSDVCKLSTDTEKTITETQPEDDSKEEKESKESKSNSKVKPSLKSSKDCENSFEIEDNNMHYKKQLLLNSGTNSNSSDSHTGSLTANIDVNLSVIDQVTKLAKAEKRALNGDGKSDSETTSTNISPSQNVSSSLTAREKSEHVDMKPQEINVERSRESNVGFQAYVSRSNTTTPAMDERSDSRASDERSTSSVQHDKRLSSQFDDLKNVKSSPASSPLVVDRHDPVLPYRDPELMKQNPVLFSGGVHNIISHSKTLSQPSYPTVHTPVPATPAALPTCTSYSSLPLSRQILTQTSLANHYQLPPTLGGITRPLTLPPGYSQLDATLAAHAQQQQIHALQLQNAHLMHLPYSLSGNPRLHQLEVLWQQKFPSIPVPSPWLLMKHQEELLSDVTSLHRERELSLERERMERAEMERLERECVERERRKERERIEKERQEKERERIEKEKQERERSEKERLERNRQEQNRLRREREQKTERGRILREAIDSVAAVDHHFTESLRLASQRGLGGQWPTPSITLGTGKVPKSEAPAHHAMMQSEKQDDKDRVKREIERERYHESLRQSEEKKYLAQSVHDIPEAHKKADVKNEVKLEGKSHPYNYIYPYGSAPFGTSSSHGIKQEQPIFSLYGYPSNPSVITKDQLHSYGLGRDDSIKEEKPEHKLGQPSPAHSNPTSLSPRSKDALLHMSKDVKHHGSVIVDNRSSKSNSPSSQYGGSRAISPLPRLQPRPAHTPEQRDQNSVSPASGIPHHLLSQNLMSSGSALMGHSTAFRVQESKSSSRSQSPFKATSQSHHPGIMAQPIDYCKNSNKAKSAGSSPTNPSSNPPVSSPYHPSVAQPPVSLPPTSLAYSYSLIQQGLVPNPIYSHGPTTAAPKGGNQLPVPTGSPAPTHCFSNSSPVNAHHAVPAAASSMTASQNVKRKSNKDNSVRKRQKAQNEVPNMSSPLSIPVTTPQIITNHNPYTTTSSNNNTPARTSVMSSVPGTQPSTESVPSVLQSSFSKITGYNDSFKSFVENTVQSAYLEEEKKPPEKAEAAPKPTIVNEDSSSSTVTNASNLSNNIASIMDTINRVANGHADTDSDTLSAPSPPPKSDSSPVSLSSSNHRNMKKAWLQRHSDASKEVKEANNVTDSPAENKPSNMEVEETNSSEDKCDNSLQGGGLPNGNVNSQNHNDESTSSASETESQSVDSNTLPKKRVKTKKSTNNSGAKKIKTEDGATTTSPVPPNNQTRKKPNNKRSKPDIKQEKKPEVKTNSPAECENSGDEKMDTSDCKSEDKMSSKASSVSSPAPSHHESDVSMESTTNSTGSNNNSKEKKKTRRSKENSKTSEKQDGSFNKPLVKVSVATLKRTCEPFVQDGPCVEIAPKLMKCRECKMSATQLSKKQPNIFCRFYAFRRLKYNNKGAVSIYGFSELSDADPDDIEPWLPRTPVQMPKLDIETSKFIISKVGDKFCELVEQERESMALVGKNGKIAWKRAVQGVREMCDVCDTTLFNMHWVCNKCGFVVCLDCYKAKVKGVSDTKADEDHKWLTCSSNRSAHEPDKMMLTQIIPSDALWELGRLIHDIRGKWSIPATCPCGHGNDSKFPNKNGLNQQIVNSVNNKKMVNGVGDDHHKPAKGKKNKNLPTVNGNKTSTLENYNPDTTSSPLSLLADVAFLDSEGSRDKSDSKKSSGDKSSALNADLDSDKKVQPSCSTLRELLTKTAGKAKVASENSKKNSKPKTSGSTLDDIIQSVVEKSCRDSETQPFKFMHYIPRLGGWKRDIPIAVHNLTETSVLYPDVPHSWLCDGKLLRLHDPKHKGNLRIFQEQWKRGQPVLVSGTNKFVNIDLWRPETFSKEFGHVDNDLVNCRNGNVIIGHPMCDFWDGFEYLGKRPTDEKDEPMLLKLKDWPPGDDFSDLLPSRFRDLMQALPLPDYTHRQGKLNLASRLPDFLVRPDLGPKMYNAYGSANFPSEGTTNLHLDISDAVNVMVYVGVPCDGEGGRKAHEQAALKAIDDADCDSITKRRVREVHEVPGALWQIYDAHDADKIRDFLNKVAKECGETIEPDHDPIHDQSWYLDEKLRERLGREYGVHGYTIVQCLGDAIFIPAGAPHQVRNLHSCVKVAEDFVAPEHLNHCFRLTQEFRQLSDTHSNHEDKLQVKNIIYHAVKDAVAVLRDTDPEDE